MYIDYTLKSQYGEVRAFIVDDAQRIAVESLTKAKSLTRTAASGLKSLGFELYYHGDMEYEDDPIYPHGHHFPWRPFDVESK